MTLAEKKNATSAFLVAAVQLLGCADLTPELAGDATRAEVRVTAEPALQVQSSSPLFGQVRVVGKGCPPNSYIIDYEGDDPSKGGSFSVAFSRFTAAIGPSRPAEDATTHCNISVPIRAPAGLQYAVSNFKYRGYADLQRNVTLHHFADYRFAGTDAVASPDDSAQTLSGPWARSFLFQDDVTARTPALLNWSACATQAILLINVREVLSASAPQQDSSLLTIDAVDGKLSQLEVGLTSRSCVPR